MFNPCFTRLVAQQGIRRDQIGRGFAPKGAFVRLISQNTPNGVLKELAPFLKAGLASQRLPQRQRACPSAGLDELAGNIFADAKSSTDIFKNIPFRDRSCSENRDQEQISNAR